MGRIKMKRFLAAFLACALVLGSAPTAALAVENDVQAADVTGELQVQFEQEYAQAGKELSTAVTGADDVSYVWYVGGKQIANMASSYTPTEDDVENWIKVEVTSGTATASAEMYFSNLPVIYIDTEGGQAITSKEEYINADIKIQGNETYNSETTTLYEGVTEIRGRGNSTWSKPKKPYRLKLNKKTDVFGMGKSKHWVLLANYMDESLMRNTYAYDLSGSMGMEQMSTVWTTVILNGDYVGNYQFCENVRVDDTRIDIFDWEGFAEDSAATIAETEGLSEDLAGDLETYMLEQDMSWITSGTVTFNGTTYTIADYPDIKFPESANGDYINGGYILELDEYYDEVSKFKTASNQPIMFKNPEFVSTSPDMMSFVQTYVQAFENAVQEEDYSVEYNGEETHYSELYDFDSLVDYWLICEIFFQEEMNKKSTYMYKGIDELMKMGPIWDMDWSSGCEIPGSNAAHTDKWATQYFNANAQANQWYKYLVQDPYFLVKAQERYWEIRYAQLQDMLDRFDADYEYLKESAAANGARWGYGQSYKYYADDFDTWMNTHVAWLDEKMASEESLDSSFVELSYNADSKLQLTLKDAAGSELNGDIALKAAADYSVTPDSDVVLAVDGIAAGSTADVYVNSFKYGQVEAGKEITIPASVLTAVAGEKNVIEVKAGTSKNYVTVREKASETDTGVDKVALYTLIYEANEKAEANYRPDTWAAFEEAYANACAAALNTAATQDEVNAAKDALEKAMGALVEVKNPADSSYDYDISKITYTAGTEQEGEGIDKAFDNNTNTFWHSQHTPASEWYQNNPQDYQKYLWVQFELEEATLVDAVRYLQRTGNGDITSYRVEGSTDGKSWTALTEGNWDRNDSDWKAAEFTPTVLKYIRLVATGTYAASGTNKHASARELRIRMAGDINVTPTPTPIPMEVEFDQEYAQAGKKLSVTVADATEDVTYTWYVGGKKIANTASSYTPTEDDVENWIKVEVTSGTAAGAAEMYFSNLPVIYIDTEGGQEIVSKEEYINADIKIQGNELYNSETTTLYEGVTEIRGRGNTTWSQPKKPYRLKLDDKTDVFGMGKSKHWVLLANYLDESLMRNTYAYDLSGSMDMEQMSTVWTTVILNGDYVGNYQFCENVRVDDTRIDIFDWEGFAEDSAAAIAETEGLSEDLAGDLETYMLEQDMSWITSGTVKFNGATYNIADYPDIEFPSAADGDYINGGYILELDQYYDEVSKFKTESDQPIMFKNPEFVGTNKDMMRFVQTYVQAFEDAVQEEDYSVEYNGEETHYSELYDFDSLVDYWLICEIFFQEEINKKSTYMYKDVDELMKMGPIWDMDWSSGSLISNAKSTTEWATEYFNDGSQASQWYKYLVQDPYFLMKAQERYWEIRDVQLQAMLDRFDGDYEYLKEAAEANGERWGYSQSYSYYANHFDTWMNAHVTWLDEQMASEDSLDSSLGVLSYNADSKLQLTLKDAGGTELNGDTAQKAAADYTVASTSDVVLTVDGIAAGSTADVYVNGFKYAQVKAGQEITIPAEALTAEAGEKNVIEVKAGTSKNYVTVKEDVDKTALERLIAEAQDKKESDYTADSWAAFEEAYADAYTTVLDPVATQAEVNAAKDALEKAMAELVEVNVTPTPTPDKPGVTPTPTPGTKPDVTPTPGAKPTPTPDKPFRFDDVQDEEAYYFDPVYWAYENGITTGETKTLFAPEKEVNRAAMVTFIWRAEGEKEAKNTVCTFKDVDSGHFYYDAMLWAVENGITQGYNAETFGPNDGCTRAQMVTFLWRAAGEPKVNGANPFKDVSSDAYYYNAVLWAVQNGITTGVSATSFEPDSPCTRGQAVTFLERSYN